MIPQRPWYDYAINYGMVGQPFAALPVCADCGHAFYAGHICPGGKEEPLLVERAES